MIILFASIHYVKIYTIKCSKVCLSLDISIFCKFVHKLWSFYLSAFACFISWLMYHFEIQLKTAEILIQSYMVGIELSKEN